MESLSTQVTSCRAPGNTAATKSWCFLGDCRCCSSWCRACCPRIQGPASLPSSWLTRCQASHVPFHLFAPRVRLHVSAAFRFGLRFKAEMITSVQVGMLQLPFRLSAPVSAHASLESMPSLAGLGPQDGFSTPANQTMEYAATRTGESRLFT